MILMMRMYARYLEDELLRANALSMGEPMTGISPIAPKRNAILPKHSTPKHSANPDIVSKTPKTPLTEKPLPLTPSQYKTPQQHSSILKQSESVLRRKRHVAFASDEEDSLDDSISACSSTSQLMEIEFSEEEKRLTASSGRPRQRVQPLHVTPTRKGQTPQAPVKISPPSKRIPFKPNPRGKQPAQKGRSYFKPKKMRPLADMPSEMTQAEVSRFKELYPEEDHNDVLHTTSQPKAKKTFAASENTRKTPNRIFKVKGLQDSTKNRKKAKATAGKTKETVDLSWFDNDAVYGFFD